VIGFATGIMQATVPCYVTEVSPREIRGIMLSFFNMASEYCYSPCCSLNGHLRGFIDNFFPVNIGGLAATVIPWATNKRWPGEDDLRSFRVPLYVALAAPALTLIAEVFLLVESPYWLMMKGRKEQARKALAFINPKSSEVDLDRAVAVLEYTLEKEAEANEQVIAECFPMSKGSSAHQLFWSNR
jgi:MFS family permease